MMKKIVWTTLGTALIIVGVTAAWTQTKTWRGGHGPFWFYHGPMGYIAHELDLSDRGRSAPKTSNPDAHPIQGAFERMG